MSLRVEGVSVTIGDNPILTEVDLVLADREVVAVLGPSGSGKTTLLRVIAGLQPPTTGAVILDGNDITNQAVHRRDIGLMFQDHALFPHRSVAGNVAFGLRMGGTGRSEIAERVDEVLDLVGLGGFGPRPIDGLSGGERQRVALARALAPRPRLLMLDEPLGSLDRALRERLVDDLAEVLRASGVAAIYVTHDQSEAFAMGDRLAVMRSGSIVQVDRPEQVWTAPVDAGVAAIVGPVSLIPVEVGVGGTVPEPWRRVVAERSYPPGPHSLVVRADTFSLGPSDITSGSDSLIREDGAVIGAAVVGVTFRGDHHLVVVETASGERIRVAHRAPSVPRPGDRVALTVVRPPVLVPPAP